MNVEATKIVGAVLTAMLVTWAIGIIGHGLVTPKRLDQPAYVVTGAEPKATAAAAPAAVEPIGRLLAAASAEAGKALIKPCVACHTFAKGGKNGVGPNLWDVVGGKKARVAGFGYSPGMQAMAQKPGEDGHWGYEQINAFLANPKGYLAGTKMAFAGIRKTEERAHVIAYLRSLADSPKPLP
ncbi:MAG: c-type cytochrome [Pseudomonadota bacterium]